MWVGAIQLRIRTKDAPNAGTDSLMTATIVRDGVEIRKLKLDYPAKNDLERGSVRSYYYKKAQLPRINDQTPELPPNVGQDPMPYPSYGIEFSNGLEKHLTVRVRIHGADMWISDQVDLYVREIREVATSFDTYEWKEDGAWTYVGTTNDDKAMSTDPAEGISTWNLNVV